MTRNSTQSSQQIARMERKVERQWRRAQGDLLTFSDGFSFRRPLDVVSEEDPVHVTFHPRSRARRTRRLALAAALIATVLGGAWAWAQEHPQRPVAVQTLF